MNRLVIIGNGFDLAHGLPTSYRDFIDDFWRNIVDYFQNELVKEMIYIDDNHPDFRDYYLYNLKSFQDFDLRMINAHKNNKVYYRQTEKQVCNISNIDNLLFEFKNDFFRIICEKNSKNWVDIENEYYIKLKKIALNTSLNISRKNERVKKLNDELIQVKKLLEDYLTSKVLKGYSIDNITNQNTNLNIFYEVLKPISLFSNQSNIYKEFIHSEDIKEIEEHFEKEKEDELVNNLYFLNFNYTSLANVYCQLLNLDDRIQCYINFIHGELENKNENKINFGFGDEMDEDYKRIENINDNEYLKNFKSFQYLQNSNYSNLLSYIDSDKFQVLIMGHSCGLSDRTLLNTIFEHNNCRSIKIYYHEWEDEDTGVKKDNYTEISQNISRHFNKKKLMREKIVNKTLCKPLPQIQLQKK